MYTFKQFNTLNESDEAQSLSYFLAIKNDMKFYNEIDMFFRQNFILNGKAPRGMKKQWGGIQYTLNQLDILKQFSTDKDFLKSTVINIKNTLGYITEDDWAKLTAKTGAKVKKDIVINKVTYVNESPMGVKAFAEMAETLSILLNRLTGSRKKVLGKKLIIKVVKGIKSKASYSLSDDVIQIKYSPKVTSLLNSDLYGWLNYIIIHELGHRYEVKFGRPDWYVSSQFLTTKYSKVESFSLGEDWAECFALGFFGASCKEPKWDTYKHKIELFNKNFK